jgi:hypothetical protein
MAADTDRSQPLGCGKPLLPPGPGEETDAPSAAENGCFEDDFDCRM